MMKRKIMKKTNEILIESWQAWLDHTGYNKDDQPLDYFIDRWKKNKFSEEGAWIEAWVGGTISAGLPTIDIAPAQKITNE